MKKNIWKLSALFLSGLFMFACSSEEKDLGSQEETMELSINLDLGDISTRTAVDDNAVEDNNDGTNMPCGDPDNFAAENYTALITIHTNGDPSKEVQYRKKIRKVSTNPNKFVTDPISLGKPTGNNHKLHQVLIVDNNNDNNIHWSSVADITPDSKYEAFVTHKTPQEIVWGENDGQLEVTKKKEIPMQLLCAVNEYAEDFGYGQWGLDLVKVHCFNYSVNVCGDPCDESVKTGHKVGETEVVISKFINNKWESFWDGSSNVGEIGEICVHDQLAYADKDEKFLISISVEGYGTISAEVTGEAIFGQGYTQSGFWEIPQGNTTGYLHFDLCDLKWTKQDPATVVPVLFPKQTNPWHFTVTVPQICDRVCDPECGDIFAQWTTGDIFGRCQDPCSWETYCGHFTKLVKDGKFKGLVTSTHSPRRLVTPGNMFKQGDKISVTFTAPALTASEIQKGKTAYDLLSLELMPRATKPASAQGITTKTGNTRKTYTVEITVPRDDCFAISMYIPCRKVTWSGYGDYIEIVKVEKIPASN